MINGFGAAPDQSAAINTDLPILRLTAGANFFLHDWIINLVHGVAV